MGISRSRIYELLNSGELPSYKDGRRRLILVADIEARLARLPSAPTPTRALPEPPTGPLLPPEQQETAIARATEYDWADLYNERLKLLRPDVNEDEARARAYDYTVRFCRDHSGLDLEAAKQVVLAAIAKVAAQGGGRDSNG
jgi:excisionase family DNA binding protein